MKMVASTTIFSILEIKKGHRTGAHSMNV